MSPDLLQPMILMFLVAIGVVAFELRKSLDPPTCPQCVHCRLLAAEKRQEEEKLGRWEATRLFDPDRDEDERTKKR